MNRTCTKCGVEKPEGDFRLQRRRGGSFSRMTRCRRCEYDDGNARKARQRAEMKLPDDIPTELAFQNSIPVLPPASPDEERWKQNAACRGMTDQFLQPRDDGTKRAVCMSCSAFGECRALVDLIEMHALGSNGYQAGFWAGETPIERRRRRGRYTNVHDTRKAA